MVGFDNQYPLLATCEHPILSNQLIPVQMLTLVKAKLQDGHLEVLKQKLKQLELLNLAFNEFTTDGLQTFINSLNQQPQSEMKLRSINLAGNSLKDAEIEVNLQKCLHEFLQRVYLQHVDLSMTQMRNKTAKVCMQSLKTSRSVQSLHLSGQNVEKLTQVAERIFQSCLYNQMHEAPCPDEISDDWNQEYQVPDLKLTSISDNVASSIIGNNCKRECAAKLSTNNMDYSEQRFVLSRLMGRNDLSDFQSWIRSDMRDSSGNPYDIRKDLSLEMQKEVERGRRKPADLCWVMS